MSLEYTKTLTRVRQIVDLNDLNMFTVASVSPEETYQLGITTQDELDQGTTPKMMQVSGAYQGVAEFPHSVLVLTADTPVEVKISLSQAVIQTRGVSTSSSGSVFLGVGCGVVGVVGLYFIYRWVTSSGTKTEKMSPVRPSMLEQLSSTVES